MDQNTKRIGLINWVVLLAATVGLSLVSRYVNSLAGIMAAIVTGIGFLVAFVSFFQAGLEGREQLEKLELDEMSQARGGESLFTGTEGEGLPAQRSREQFEKYVVPAFTVLLFLGQCLAVYLPWKMSVKLQVLTPERASLAMAFMGLISLVLLLLGKYSSGVARIANQRLLRPGSTYSLLGAYAGFAAIASIIAVVLGGFPKVDFIVARVMCVITGLIAAETLLGLVMEIYRVRVKGREARLLYESRLVSLLGKPEAIFTTAAHALDYQFGFKVSETAFYRFLQEWLPLLIGAQAFVLLLFTCLAYVGPGEEGLLTRLGAPVQGREILQPGLHVKWPWPVDIVRHYRTEQIQTIIVGSESEAEHEGHEEGTVVWTVAHGKEDNLLVASREMAIEDTNSAAEKKSPPVNLLSVGIPVQYQITNLLSWVYVNQEPQELLKGLATREVVRYLASADLEDLMAHGREVAGTILRKRIQALADEHQLGVRIVFAGVADIHPPVKVAAEYEKVIGELQTKEANILAAQAAAVQTNAWARGQAFKVEREAEAERDRLITDAAARTTLFANQMQAYNTAPLVYRQRAYLQTLVRGAADARKYVITATNTTDMFQLNLEDKIRRDLEDVKIKK